MTSIEVARSRKLLSAISPGKKARLSGDKSVTDRARWQAGMGSCLKALDRAAGRRRGNGDQVRRFVKTYCASCSLYNGVRGSFCCFHIYRNQHKQFAQR